MLNKLQIIDFKNTGVHFKRNTYTVIYFKTSHLNILKTADKNFCLCNINA